MTNRSAAHALRALCMLSLGGVLLAGTARAATDCAPAQQAGYERCVSGLPPATFARMQQWQKASNWCWAASISMVLRRYGVAVPQEQVVRTHYGSSVNLGVTAATISELLNRAWRDSTGRSVVTSTAALPAPQRPLGLLAPDVIADLTRGKPLIIGAQQHAVVLVKVVYERRVDGGEPRLVDGVVLDPASDSGLRSIRRGEHVPDYVARIEVDAEAALALDDAAPASTLLAQRGDDVGAGWR
ncbi:MAG TPA: papain-like cysteine protease family protein [Ramlibacter sp.]|jgi:hypothetical protein|uniref:papain-like cysteine protease family protein n=1 Tax=Ramlibacter sp. TaxID=1917967 RepID=UPI002D739A46|nr:papain-like cysteine protease family protein [Ramlibacter sp.]HZY17894.1 papain-like cysteine protease family protein [Ramlibacter sp.]